MIENTLKLIEKLVLSFIPKIKLRADVQKQEDKITSEF